MLSSRVLRLALPAAFVIATSTLIAATAYSQANPKITKAMADLKAMTEKLGPPKLEGMDPVSGKDASALYFGKTKINNDFTIVDAVVKDNGGTATLFAKTGAEYVRVSTNVPKGNGRATGTILDPKGKAIVQINEGKPFYGDVDILGTMYTTGYEPIRDASGKVIGIWYVGYKK
ncbi:MAG TPA: Cache 3/Cache 2 fusion domain-containing protein [Rhodoblastus sp.]|nr:Cache 3/Cache 2 fusion domain-containing protein [Rhodoblastus sp.]